MLELLQSDVVGDLRQLLDPDRSKIVAGLPTERLVARESISVREPVDVIRHDADLDDARAVALRFREQEAQEKLRTSALGVL